MNMFSYDTFEKEGKYHLCGGGVNLSNYESNYNTQSEAWNNEAVTFSENKTLTNKWSISFMEIPMKKIKNQRMELFLLSGMP